MSKPSVLIVEDNRDLRYLYTYALFTGFEVRTAQNGADAIVEVLDYKPDIIITDINLPVLDGIEFMQVIKRDAELSDIPIVVVSGASRESLARAEEAGAVKVLKKPVDPNTLLDELLQILPEAVSH
jgi:CheY-like chemotaxis protein